MVLIWAILHTSVVESWLPQLGKIFCNSATIQVEEAKTQQLTRPLKSKGTKFKTL